MSYLVHAYSFTLLGVKFAGFSAESLAERMQDGEVSALITTGKSHRKYEIR